MTGNPNYAAVEEIIRQGCPFLEEGASIAPDARLEDFGFDSLETVSALTAIEERFEIIFPEEDLTFETFSTMANLWKVICRICGILEES